LFWFESRRQKGKVRKRKKEDKIIKEKEMEIKKLKR